MDLQHDIILSHDSSQLSWPIVIIESILLSESGPPNSAKLRSLCQQSGELPVCRGESHFVREGKHRRPGLDRQSIHQPTVMFTKTLSATLQSDMSRLVHRSPSPAPPPDHAPAVRPRPRRPVFATWSTSDERSLTEPNGSTVPSSSKLAQLRKSRDN